MTLDSIFLVNKNVHSFQSHFENIVQMNFMKDKYKAA